MFLSHVLRYLKDFQPPPRKESDHSFTIQHMYGALTMLLGPMGGNDRERPCRHFREQTDKEGVITTLGAGDKGMLGAHPRLLPPLRLCDQPVLWVWNITQAPSSAAGSGTGLPCGWMGPWATTTMRLPRMRRIACSSISTSAT